jgi:membrane protein YdbS with pleckstrin-like domain
LQQTEQTIVVIRDRLGCVTWLIYAICLFTPLLWWSARTTTVTTTRVVMQRGVLFSKSEVSIPLRNITAVDVERSPLAAQVTVRSATERFHLGSVTHGAAEQIQTAIANARATA